MLYMIVILFCTFQVIVYACTPATYIWPLGENIDQFELTSVSWAGSVNGISYEPGSAELGYNAIAFNSTNQAYVDTRIPYSADLTNDFTISFNVYAKENGVFFHYKSDEFDNPTGSYVQSLKLEWAYGNIKTHYSDGTTHTRSTSPLNLANDAWHNILFNIDLSKTSVKFTGAAQSEVEHHAWISDLDRKFPGTLRFGGSLDNDSFFTGRVSCVMILPCKNPGSGYNSECDASNWLQYTSTSTTSSSTTTTPTTTTTTPTPTTTTTPTPTTTTTPTPTSTTTPTPTTTTTPTPTSTTTPTPTTTTTPTPTSTTTPTPTTTTSPTTTVTSPLTTTVLTSALPLTTAGPPALSWLTLAVEPTEPLERCINYQILQLDATFDLLSMFVLSTQFVADTLECSKSCSKHVLCETFSFKGGICRLAEANPVVMFESGTTIYSIF